MKTTINKKLVGGLLIGLMFTAIGTVLVTAQADVTTQETIPPIPFGGRHGFGPYAYNLTEDQQAEIEEILATLREQNATREEVQAAIQDKLEEFGVLDIQLENEIAQTQQRLEILNREKELRDEGYSWDEINTIIQDEFGLEEPICLDIGIPKCSGFGQGPHGAPPEFTSGEEIQQ